MKRRFGFGWGAAVFFRVGSFFILFGISLMALFLLSAIANMPDFKMLLLAGGGILLGIFLQWTNPSPSRPPSSRFRLLRKKREEESEDRPH